MRQNEDPRKKDFSPTILDFGNLILKVARHFGFCYGVENAIEISYRALSENPSKRVFLLSEMIHNPHVNRDLERRGVKFIMQTDGSQVIPFDQIRADDIVIVPAFGTTTEMFSKLREIGVDPLQYNATCPFVEKVWRRAEELGKLGFSVVIHGKERHEETRATFSHAVKSAPSIIVRDIEEAALLASYIRGAKDQSGFYLDFDGRYSTEFNPVEHLRRIGVVNQTTMLASETQQITELLRAAITDRFGAGKLSEHFADTRDTLCYATSENQDSVYALLESGGDLAVVVGGYNSSNTSHLVELCQGKVPTYYIKDAQEIIDRQRIRHLDLANNTVVESRNWLSNGTEPLTIILTAGASCPDALVDEVIVKICEVLEIAERYRQQPMRITETA